MSKLSYSSATLLQNCEQKYAHRKILETKIDKDSSDSTEAFDVGKAFHQVLEDTLHTRLDILKNVEASCKKFKVVKHQAMIHAMVENYLDMHELSGLTCVLCELEISDQTTIGYIDAIMKDAAGFWWIVDLKTSARWNENILSRLPKDYQLNLYSNFADRFAGILDLELHKFRGCRYRVTTKSKANQKETESYDAFVKRLKRAVKVYDVVVPEDIMDVSGVAKIHQENYERSMKLRGGETPKKNLSYCESYFRPCEYFSNCHGKIFTEAKDKVEIKTADIYKRDLEDIGDL